MLAVREKLSRTRLEYKILLILALGLTFGYGSYVIYTIKSEKAALLAQHRQMSRLFAESLKVGIRNLMLSGRPSYVRSLIDESRGKFKGIGSLRLFNNESKEIFSETEKYISRTANDSAVAMYIQSGRKPPQDTRDYVLLENEKSCQNCHGSDHAVRGVMRMELLPGLEQSGELAGHIATQAFKSIMLSGKGETADGLMSAIGSLHGVTRAQIYDRDGYYVAFGNDEDEVPEPILEEAVASFADSPESELPLFFREENHQTYIFALKNEKNCQVCHGADHSVRGMLALSLDNQIETDEEFPEKVAAEGFKNMMLMQRGLYAGEYVDRVRRLSLVKTFEVFDNGRKHLDGIQKLYISNPEFTQAVFDDSVDQLILSVNRQTNDVPQQMEYQEVSDYGVTYLTQIFPLMNDEKCQACHQPPKEGDARYELYRDRWKIRSALMVSTSMEPVMGEIQRNLYTSIGLSLLSFLAVDIILRIFMKVVVLRPLTIIGETAQEIGQGKLGVSAEVSSKDEIGTLALQINNMIQGLRERLHLTRFESSETVEAVKEADLAGVSLGGERKEATVLLSDMRGFTAYSEIVEPERVIEMLNTFLNEQAQIVKEDNGDIDKFVGDRLMAVFQGEKMVEDAINCGIAIQNRMIQLIEPEGEPVYVGIGINAGPMVMGAMGTRDRMDYTVLGDNVDLGARLCSAAQSRQIIVSQRAIDLLANGHHFDLKELEPIFVKEKEEPIHIYDVRYL